LNLRILYHNNCFDGACSASLFTRFHRDVIATASSYAYQGVMHRPGGEFDPADFTGDENAIVDFKYSPSPRITWWFDHHQSAFLTPEDHQHFLAQQADGSHALRHFFDPHYISCTGFIAHIAKTKFAYDTTPFADLIHWANIVDGAKYESAKAAVEMAEPAMKLTMVIESTTDPTFIPHLIPLLTEFSFADILAQPFVDSLVEPLLARHHAAIDLIRDRAPSPSTSPTSPPKATASSSPTTCTPTPPTSSASASRLSARRSPSEPTPGPPSLPPTSSTSPPSASVTEAEATPVLAPPASPSTGKPMPAKPPPRSRPSSKPPTPTCPNPIRPHHEPAS